MFPPWPRTTVVLSAATALALTLAGCTGGSGSDEAADCVPAAIPAATSSAAPSPAEPAPSPTAERECDQVTYLTAFGAFGRDGFAWCGRERGIFADRNIDVTIELGSGTEDNFSALLGGQAQFVLVAMVGGLIALGDDVTDWKAVAAIHQNEPAAWMTLDPDLVTVQDLEGETIGLPPGGTIESIWPTYASLSGADPDKITIEDVQGPDLPGALVSGNVSAIGQFAYGVGGIRAAAEGQEVYVHPVTDVLTDLYGLALVTTDELIETNPDLVTRFRAALLDSLAWSLNNTDECGRVMVEAEDAVQQPPEVAAGEMALMAPYSRVGNTPIGHISDERLVRMIGTLEASGAIPEGITPEQVVDFGFIPEGLDQ